MIKIVLTDDHLLVTEGISNALKTYDHIEVIGTYGNGQELLAGLRTIVPDVLLLDVQLPDSTGADLVTNVLDLYPSLKIIILSGSESAALIAEMMQAGCRGYLLKSTTNGAVLADAVQKVFDGRLYLESSVQERLLENILRPGPGLANDSGKTKLTAREKDVLASIAAGLSNQQIAAKLFISIRTVENHRYNLLQKMGEKNAVGLVKAAMKLGLIDPAHPGH